MRSCYRRPLLWRKAERAGVFVDAGGKAQWREITPGLRGKIASTSRRD